MRTFTIFSVLLLAGVEAVAPIISVENAETVSDSFLVVLKSDLSTATIQAHSIKVSEILSSSDAVKKSDFDLGGWRGYHVEASRSVVAYIEPDQIFTLPAFSTTTAPQHASREIQTNASWGLGRISHRQKGSSDYVFEPTGDTYIYVLDTGVRITHQKFEGRASHGFNAVGGSPNDVNGHGTHIAGTASSQTYGVTRFANVISVKVLGDEGSTSTSVLISGINWAVQDMQDKNRVGKATALLAVGGSKSVALNAAVANGSNAGLFFAAVAGNSNSDAGNYSPGSEPSACTVGGTTIDDAKMSSSNYGPLVDIFAPGQQIPSLWITSDTSTQILSGTSMAAAHIAGLGAYFLALEGPRTPVALCERLREVATRNVLSVIPSGTANLIAYNLSGL